MMIVKQILDELKNHSPLTIFGAITGIIMMILFHNIPSKLSYNIFYTLHPTHVILSALVTGGLNPHGPLAQSESLWLGE